MPTNDSTLPTTPDDADSTELLTRFAKASTLDVVWFVGAGWPTGWPAGRPTIGPPRLCGPK